MAMESERPLQLPRWIKTPDDAQALLRAISIAGSYGKAAKMASESLGNPTITRNSIISAVHRLGGLETLLKLLGDATPKLTAKQFVANPNKHAPLTPRVRPVKDQAHLKEKRSNAEKRRKVAAHLDKIARHKAKVEVEVAAIIAKGERRIRSSPTTLSGDMIKIADTIRNNQGSRAPGVLLERCSALNKETQTMHELLQIRVVRTGTATDYGTLDEQTIATIKRELMDQDSILMRAARDSKIGRVRLIAENKVGSLLFADVVVR